MIIGSYTLTMGVLSFVFGCYDGKKNASSTDPNAVKNVAPAVNRV
jgi:hypothetical protein